MRFTLVLFIAASVTIGCNGGKTKVNKTEIEGKLDQHESKNWEVTVADDQATLTNPECQDSDVEAMVKALNESGAPIAIIEVTGEITDAGLEALKAANNVRSLSISGAKITSAGLKHLKDYGIVEQIALLNCTELDNAAIESLSAMTSLESISLQRASKVTGGLEHLAGLQKLKSLDLQHTSLSDDGLLGLPDLENLENLYIGHTKVSLKGLERVKSGFPKLENGDVGIQGLGISEDDALNTNENLQFLVD